MEQRRQVGAAAVALVVAAGAAVGGTSSADEGLLGLGLGEYPVGLQARHGTFPGAGEIVLSPENNHLNAYDLDTGARYRVITSAHEDGESGRDINGQICVDPDDPRRFVAGEDTGQGTSEDASGVAGWGWFELTDDVAAVPADPQAGELLAGDRDGIGATQIGKLAPAYVGTPDNHGCGFLSDTYDHALLTATIGDIFPGDPAGGEVILWARDEHGSFGWGYTTSGRPTLDSPAVNTPYGTTPYCKLFVGVPTAGGMWVDEGDRIYVAGNRPAGQAGNPLGGTPGGIYRLALTDGFEWPRYDPVTESWDGCSEVAIADAAQAGRVVTEWRIDPERVTVALLPLDIYVGPVNPLAVTPSGVVGSGRGTIYVSSVFTGTIMEYTLEGRLVRPVLLPGEGILVDGVVTPFGMAVDSAGDLWVADLGQAAVSVIPLTGSVVKITMVDVGDGIVPGPPAAVDRGLTYPDGLGVTTLDGLDL